MNYEEYQAKIKRYEDQIELLTKEIEIKQRALDYTIGMLEIIKRRNND